MVLSAEDLVAYIAAVAAQPAFTARRRRNRLVGLSGGACISILCLSLNWYSGSSSSSSTMYTLTHQ